MNVTAQKKKMSKHFHTYMNCMPQEIYFRQDLQDLLDYFLFFTSRMQVKKPNPPAAEVYLFSFVTT